MPRPRKDGTHLPAVRKTGVGRRFTHKTTLSRSEIIAIELKRLLAEGHYQAGDLFPSQNELARMFATSTVTSREAVLLLVKEGLLERRFGSGTYATGRTPERFVAVVTELDISHPAASPAFLVQMQGVRRHLAEAGYQTRVYIGHRAPTSMGEPDRISSWEFWHDLEAKRIIGLVLVGTEPTLAPQAVGDCDIPFIDGTRIDGIPFWSHDGLIECGLKALMDRGCRQIACVAGGKTTTSSYLDRFRREAVRLGIDIHPEWLVSVPYLHEHGDGANAFKTLWESRPVKPDGLLVLDDMLYHDMAPFLLMNGIDVPRDLVVASHANLHDPHPFVPDPIRLTLDMDAVGQAMARNLINRMQDPDAPPVGIPVPIRVIEPAAE